jgi:hypothetical protein
MARFTATQIRWGHSERNEIYCPNSVQMVTTRLAFNRRYFYYYVSVYSSGVMIVPEKNAGTRIKEARQLFEKISEAVSHAVTNEYINLP